MSADLYPLRVLLTTLAGWMNRQQQDVIAYLVEENRVLKEQLKGKRLPLDDEQRRRLAAKAVTHLVTNPGRISTVGVRYRAGLQPYVWRDFGRFRAFTSPFRSVSKPAPSTARPPLRRDVSLGHVGVYGYCGLRFGGAGERVVTRAVT